MPKYVFHHLPRCGGTSCKAVFRQWFPLIQDYRKDWSARETVRYLSRRIDLDDLRDDTMLAGHFEIEGARLLERYPELMCEPDVRVITFVRDPLEIAVSMHHYAKRQRADYPFHSLTDRLAARPNWIAAQLGCNSEDFRAVLDRYFFVGITESLQESVDVLAAKIAKEPMTVGFLNESSRDERPSVSDVREFRTRNTLDYAIHEYCRKRLTDDARRCR